LLTEPILNPQHINDFDLNDETSVSEYDEEEQNILCFDDLFPFNIIRPDDLKSEKDYEDNNNNEIIQSSEDMAPLPPREQRHIFLRYQGLEYTDKDIADFKERLERIYGREIHRVQVVDFQGIAELMKDGLLTRMRMEHRDDADVVVFSSQAWGRLFGTRGPLVWELILEFLSTLRFGEVLLDLDAPSTIQFQLGGARRRLSWRQFFLAFGLHTREEMESLGFARYWSESERMIPGKGDLHDYWRDISTNGDFLGPPPSYTLIRDPILRLYHRMMTHSISGRSLAPKKVTVTDLFAAGRKSGAHISGGQFVARLAEHFGLLTAEILGGLMFDDTWAWLAMGPERQPDAAAGAPAPAVAEDDPTADNGLGRLEEEVQGLRRDVRSLRGLVERLMTDQGRFSTWMMSCMAQLMDASGLTYQAFDGTFRGSSPVAFQRRSKQRTGEANTSAAQQDPQIKHGSKFSTIVHEYDMEPSRIFTLNARIGKRDDFKYVEAEDKSNLKTLLYQYGVSWGMDMAYRLLDLQKEINELVEVSTDPEELES
ncbi:hypothetical protein Tco_1014431, partial [Tanacetum coccineum]